MTIQNLLQDSALFKGLSKSAYLELERIALTKKLKKKQFLFSEGDDGHSMFICAEGNIQIFKTAEDGREIVIKVLKPGEIFAEVVLFESARYPASAMALSDSMVFLFPKHQVLCLLEREDFRSDFIRMLMRKQRYLVNKIKYLTLHDVEDRFFLFLKDQFGPATVIDPKMSKKDVATAIGTTPETLSRLLLRLKKEGKVDWQEKITIHKSAS
jgi:CRP/FNR family transcriptional regulator, dissimilatory nitrate respiration regulator